MFNSYRKIWKKDRKWIWQVANGEDNKPVLTRENHLSLSNKTTLELVTNDKDRIKKIVVWID
jgi:hypothetical protein